MDITDRLRSDLIYQDVVWYQKCYIDSMVPRRRTIMFHLDTPLPICLKTHILCTNRVSIFYVNAYVRGMFVYFSFDFSFGNIYF